MKPYRHLTSEERAQIEILHKEGYGVKEIAQRLDRAASTLSTELRRAAPGGCYSAGDAQRDAAAKASKARRRAKLTDGLAGEVRERLVEGWSPQQIAGRWEQEGIAAGERVSHESIYKHIWRDRTAGGSLFALLRRGGVRRRRDRCGTRRAHRLKVRPCEELAQRPAAINERRETGHWEVDLMMGAGQQGVLLVAVERVSLLVRLRSLPTREAAEVEAGMLAMLAGDTVRSLTYDRGLEWMRHASVAAAFGAQSWFCLPYHSWEKGTVENMNGQLRFYFPKQAPFPYEETEPVWVQQIEDGLNGRPRRVLGYQTPQEVSALLKQEAA